MLWRRNARPSVDDDTQPGSPEDGSERRSSLRQRWISIFGVTAFLVGSAIMVDRDGLFLSTDEVLIWVIAALVALSLSDLHRVGPRLLWDWLPFGALLILFHYAHGLSVLIGTHPHSLLQIHFDEFIFGKPLLTIQLQHAFGQTQAIRFWEFGLWGVYLTYFFLGLVVAGILWRFAYPRFRQFRAQFIVLSALACLTYVIYPADPPWLVSQDLHDLPTIYRILYEVWDHVGVHSAGGLVEQGSAFHDESAAVPSLHAGATMLVCLFFWKTAKPWARALLVIYVLAMAFTLVYAGEHYVFDIFTGWIYAVVVVVGAGIIRRRRARAAPPQPPPLESSPPSAPTEANPVALANQ
jgi:membrane-associated phospholipid phosphatase